MLFSCTLPRFSLGSLCWPSPFPNSFSQLHHPCPFRLLFCGFPLCVPVSFAKSLVGHVWGDSSISSHWGGKTELQSANDEAGENAAQLPPAVRSWLHHVVLCVILFLLLALFLVGRFGLDRM